MAGSPCAPLISNARLREMFSTTLLSGGLLGVPEAVSSAAVAGALPSKLDGLCQTQGNVWGGGGRYVCRPTCPGPAPPNEDSGIHGCGAWAPGGCHQTKHVNNVWTRRHRAPPGGGGLAPSPDKLPSTVAFHIGALIARRVPGMLV